MNQEQNQEFHQNTELHEDDVLNGEKQKNISNKPVSENDITTDVETSKNTIIIVVLAVIVVVLTLMYMWGSGIDKEIKEEALVDIEIQTPLLPDENTEALKQVNVSDELDLIEEDLITTEINTLDKDLSEMDNELDDILAE